MPEDEVYEELNEIPNRSLEDAPDEESVAAAPDEEALADVPDEDQEHEAEPEAETVYTDWAQELKVSYDRDDSRLAELTDCVYSVYGDGYSVDKNAASTIYLSGWMPVGTVAAAKTAVYESIDTFGEAPVMALDVALKDENYDE